MVLGAHYPQLLYRQQNQLTIRWRVAIFSEHHAVQFPVENRYERNDSVPSIADNVGFGCAPFAYFSGHQSPSFPPQASR